MATYGYRVMELVLTPPRRQERIAFTEPEMSGGLYNSVLAAAQDARLAGEKDATRSRYTRISRVRHDAWGILLTVKDGEYGELREIIDVDDGNPNAPTRQVGRSDAVLSDFYVLLIVPPYGCTGLLISEIKGRSHLTPETLRQLNFRLRNEGLWLRATSDTVDAYAWNEFLSDDRVGVTAIELIQTTQSPDRTHFTNENVKRAKLQIDLIEGSSTKQRILAALREMTGNSPRRPKLAGIVGLRNFEDEDFDEEHIVTVRDRRERKIDVTSNWPRFTYPIDSTDRLSEEEFVREVSGTAYDALKLLNVDVAGNWRPRIAD